MSWVARRHRARPQRAARRVTTSASTIRGGWARPSGWTCSAGPGDGLKAVKIDYEGVQTAEEFLLRTVTALRAHSSLPRQATAKLKALFDGVEVRRTGDVKVGVSTRSADRPAGRDDPQRRRPSRRRRPARDRDGRGPVAIGNIARNEGPAAAHQLLQTLRALRRTRQPAALDRLRLGRLSSRPAPVQRDRGRHQRPCQPAARPARAAEARNSRSGCFSGSGAKATMMQWTRWSSTADAIPLPHSRLAHRLHDAGTGPVTAGDVAAAFDDFMDDRDEQPRRHASAHAPRPALRRRARGG